ncbi:MAG: septal ring lytic transglycosylase RlpA family protein [Treponema sp.]|jgi:rare lipoprotein A (peptidoglycan hydrolase)|nr:septal ring lytic transglycosylase RlpA family protein [Treponema sp.]
MKRASLILLAGLLFTTPIIAQVNSFNQRGKVTQELQADGLCIAHPALPLNSKANIVNTATGKEIEVTIIRRIAPVPNRIADISPGVWKELELNPDIDVRIYTTGAAKSGSAVQSVSMTDTPEISKKQSPPPSHT